MYAGTRCVTIMEQMGIFMHLFDMLLHPVIVAIHTVAPYIGLLGYELTTLYRKRTGKSVP